VGFGEKGIADLVNYKMLNGGQRRLWSVLHTPFRVPTTGIVLNPRLDITAKLSVTH
jgi:hypothetical protein